MSGSKAIPGPVRATLERMEAFWASQDQERKIGIRLAVRGDAELEADANSAVDSRLLRRRMRERVEGVKISHPELSMRTIFRLVGAFTGLEPSWVWRLYYPRRPKVSAGSQEQNHETQPQG